MNVTQLKVKLEKHQAYYDEKFIEYSQMDMSSKQALNRYSRLLTLSNLITALIMELNTEMMIAAFTDGSEELVNSIFEEGKKKRESNLKKGDESPITSVEANGKQPHNSSKKLAELAGVRRGEIL